MQSHDILMSRVTKKLFRERPKAFLYTVKAFGRHEIPDSARQGKNQTQLLFLGEQLRLGSGSLGTGNISERRRNNDLKFAFERTLTCWRSTSMAYR